MDKDALEKDMQKLMHALENRDASLLQALAQQIHYADLADFYQEQEDEENRKFLVQSIGAELATDVIPDLPENQIEEAFLAFGDDDQRLIINQLSDDDRVDVLQTLGDNAREELLTQLHSDEERLTRNLMKFDEQTAGGRMTSRFGCISRQMTVKDAIEHLRESKDETEMLARIYVVNERGRLIGKVRLRELAFNPWEVPIQEVMEPIEATVLATADQEEAAQILVKYDLFAVPVVDEFDTLLGIITYDDVIEILEEESTEDMERLAGISKGGSSEETYLNTTPFSHFKRRFVWLLPLAILSLASGWVMWHYEDTLTSIFALAIYLPMVISAGGNSGGQASTMIIRAMSIGELEPKHGLKVLQKEFALGLLLGLGLACSMAILTLFILPAIGISSISPEVSVVKFAIAIAIALFAQVICSTVCGSVLPLGAKSLKIDPAVISSPAITTIVDVLGVFIYFNTARLILST